MVQDCWYEGHEKTNFMKLTDSGTFTLNNAQIAVGDWIGGVGGEAAVELDDFHGQVSFLNTLLAFSSALVKGDGSATDLLLLGCIGSHVSDTPWLVNQSPNATVERLMSSSNGVQIPDVGEADPIFLRKMLSQLRTETPRRLVPLPSGVSDVRIYRVSVGACKTAMKLTGSNAPPQLAAVPDQVVGEGATLSITNVGTDADLPYQTLAYSLAAGAPHGASVNPPNGVFVWTPGEEQGPSTNLIQVVVTDDGSPPLSATNTFMVTVIESNQPPVLTLPPNTNINELVHYAATAEATDPDIPANPLTLTLVSGPAGLTVSTNGEINWTPDESQGPSTNTVTISVTDTNTIAVNTTSLSVTSSFEIIIHEANVAPVLGTLSNYTVNAGQTISFTASATDADVPANILSFSLLSPPAGAAITIGGLFNWRPGVALANTSNVLQVRVQDNGAPVSNDTRSFSVVVNPLAAPVVLTPLGYSNGQFTLGVTGPLGPDYVILGSTNLQQWSDLATNLSPILPFLHADPQAGSFSNRAYRVRLSP
jgi:hypothetical protein